jgi:hypothetical protein
MARLVLAAALGDSSEPRGELLVVLIDGDALRNVSDGNAPSTLALLFDDVVVLLLLLLTLPLPLL